MRSQLLIATALGSSLGFLVPFVAVAQTPGYDWSGLYVGATAGIVNSISRTDFSYDYTPSGSLPDSVILPSNGAIGGITAGFNAQFGEFVIGIEADGSLTTLDNTANGAPVYEVDERLESLLTLRGRLGVASGPFLAYGTLGLAAGNASFSASVYDPGKGSPLPASGSGVVTGVIGGGGVEYAVNDTISVKSEALIYQLSSIGGTGDTGKGGFSADHSPGGLLVRTGINAHF